MQRFAIQFKSEFVDVAIAGKHRGLSTFYNEHNLLHQSKFGPDVELKNKPIVLFKSRRDVMQSARSVHSGVPDQT